MREKLVLILYSFFFLFFIFSFLYLSLLHYFINPADVEMGIKEPEPVSTKEDRRPLLTTQAIEVQARISQTTLRPNGLSLPEEKDTAMKETSEMVVIDPSSGFPTFLTRFDSLEFNSLPISHFHRFGPPYANFLRFFVPLLEALFKVHRDFTSGFRGGVFLGNILMELLCAGFLEGHPT